MKLNEKELSRWKKEQKCFYIYMILYLPMYKCDFDFIW